MPLHHARVDVLIAQQGQDVLEPCFALEGTHVDPLDSTSLRVFFHLTWTMIDMQGDSALGGSERDEQGQAHSASEAA